MTLRSIGAGYPRHTPGFRRSIFEVPVCRLPPYMHSGCNLETAKPQVRGGARLEGCGMISRGGTSGPRSQLGYGPTVARARPDIGSARVEPG